MIEKNVSAFSSWTCVLSFCTVAILVTVGMLYLGMATSKYDNFTQTQTQLQTQLQTQPKTVE